MERFKPCPFCGGKHPFLSKVTTNYYAEQFFVICEDCQAKSKYATSENKAIEAWNRRADNG